MLVLIYLLFRLYLSFSIFLYFITILVNLHLRMNHLPSRQDFDYIA